MFTIPTFAGICAGAVTGAWMAKRRGGSGADVAQYAAVFALIGMLIGIGVSLLVPAPF